MIKRQANYYYQHLLRHLLCRYYLDAGEISRGEREGAETAASLHRGERCEKYDDQ